MPRTVELAPSILSANFANLAAHAKQALEGGGTLLHVDIMDGHFVPNLTIGPPVVASLRKALPDTIFVRAGADLLVAGNAVFGRGDAKQNARELLDAARDATLTRA